MRDFYQLFVTGIKSMYSAEIQIVKALPDLAKAAKEPKLKEALRHHLQETQNQVERLVQIAAGLKIDLTNAENPIMEALLKEGHACAISDCPPDVKDAAIIAASQCVEHYEIAVYGTLKSFACSLKLDEAEDLIIETLQEESGADKKLSEIAEGSFFNKGVNKKAVDKNCY